MSERNTETIVKTTHQKEVAEYTELLNMLDPAERERIAIIIETAKILKITMKKMEQSESNGRLSKKVKRGA